MAWHPPTMLRSQIKSCPTGRVALVVNPTHRGCYAMGRVEFAWQRVSVAIVTERVTVLILHPLSPLPSSSTLSSFSSSSHFRCCCLHRDCYRECHAAHPLPNVIITAISFSIILIIIAIVTITSIVIIIDINNTIIIILTDHIPVLILQP